MSVDDSFRKESEFNQEIRCYHCGHRSHEMSQCLDHNMIMCYKGVRKNRLCYKCPKLGHSRDKLSEKCLVY